LPTRRSETSSASLRRVEHHQRAADHHSLAQRDDAGGDPVPLSKPARARPLHHPDRFAAADQIAQQHRLARHQAADLVEADHRVAQPGDVLARRHRLLPAASAQVLVGEVAAIRLVGREQVLERRTPDGAGGVGAEQVLDLRRVDAGCGARLGSVTVQAARQGLAPVLAPRPGDQAIEFVGRCQGRRVLAEGPGREGGRAGV
jgi:hypothetical protein